MKNKKLSKLHIISRHGQFKSLMSVQNRFLAKSLVCRCKALNKELFRVNFRGSNFKQIRFDNTKIIGCDFWGVNFTNCTFSNTNFSNCVLVGCVFKNCTFINIKFKYSYIATTSIFNFINSIDNTTLILRDIPKIQLSPELIQSIESLKENKKLRLTKLLQLTDKKINELNIFILKQYFSDKELSILFTLLNGISLKNIVTLDALKNLLTKIKKSSN